MKNRSSSTPLASKRIRNNIDFHELATSSSSSSSIYTHSYYRKTRNNKSNQIMDYEEQLLLKAEYHNTLNNDIEANQLLDEIQSTIKEVQQSEFYQNMIQQLQNSQHFQNNIHRVLDGQGKGNDHRIQMVIYGLGTIQFNYRSHYQLAMAISLTRDFSHWIKQTIYSFDPCTSPIDAKVMKALGVEVEYVNERLGRRVNGRPTLFYMPSVNSTGLENLFGVNWRPSDLNNIILFTNVYQRLDTKDLYSKSILKHTIRFDCHYNYQGPLTSKTKWPFYDITCHFFNLSFETKLEMMELRRHQEDYHEVMDEDKCLTNCLESFRFSKGLTSPGHFEWYPHSSVDQRESLLGLIYDSRLPTWPGRNEWCPPYRGWIKLNFSAAANCSQQEGRSGVVGYGGIFHNENSECLLSYSGPVLDDLDEEDVADDLDSVSLRRGLRLFIELPSRPNGRRLIIEGDSVSIVRWGNRLVPPPKRMTEVFDEIFNLLSRMSFVIFHICKQANSMAMLLASERANELQLG